MGASQQVLFAGTKLAPSSFTYVGAGTSTAVTVTIPATAAVGDLAILYDNVQNSSSTIPTSVTPAGWTAVRSDTVYDSSFPISFRCNVSIKILTSGEPGSTVTGMNAQYNDKQILVFRHNRTINNATVYSLAGEASVSAPANQTLTLSAGPTPLVGVAFWGTYNLTTTRGDSAGIMTEIIGADSYLYGKYVIYNVGSSPVDTTLSAADDGTTHLVSFYVSVN